MSHQRVSHLTCRAAQHRTSFVTESVRQNRRPVCLLSKVPRIHSTSYSSATRQRRTIPWTSSANTLVANRCFRNLPPFVQNSAAFSTARTNRAPAIATLNPRNDDDGNPMVIEISPRAAKVCGDNQCVCLSFFYRLFWFVLGMSYALSRAGSSVGEHHRNLAVICACTFTYSLLSHG